MLANYVRVEIVQSVVLYVLNVDVTLVDVLIYVHYAGVCHANVALSVVVHVEVRVKHALSHVAHHSVLANVSSTEVVCVEYLDVAESV